MLSGLVGLAFSAYEAWKCRKKAAKKKQAEFEKSAGQVETTMPPKAVDWPAPTVEQPPVWASKVAGTAVEKNVAVQPLSPPPMPTTIAHAVFLLFALTLSLGFSVPELAIVCPPPVFDFAGIDAPTFNIRWFNGPPSEGQFIGRTNATLLKTTIDSMGWNGAPFTWVDTEEALIACAGPLISSDICTGLQIKMRIPALLVGTALDPAPTTAGLFPFAAMTLASLGLALLFTAVQLALISTGKAQLMLLSPVTASIPSALLSFAFACTLASLLPTSMPSLLRRFSPSADPAMVRAVSDNFVGLGGLWWGGAQTIFGVQYEFTVLPLPPTTQVCALSTLSLNLRAAALGMIFLATLCGATFRGVYLQLLPREDLEPAPSAPAESSIEMKATAVTVVSPNPLNAAM